MVPWRPFWGAFFVREETGLELHNFVNVCRWAMTHAEFEWRPSICSELAFLTRMIGLLPASQFVKRMTLREGIVGG